MLMIFSSSANHQLVLELISQTSFSWQILKKSNIILTWKLNKMLTVLFCDSVKRSTYSKFLTVLMLTCMQRLILLSWLRTLLNHLQSEKMMNFLSLICKLTISRLLNLFYMLSFKLVQILLQHFQNLCNSTSKLFSFISKHRSELYNMSETCLTMTLSTVTAVRLS